MRRLDTAIFWAIESRSFRSPSSTRPKKLRNLFKKRASLLSQGGKFRR